MKITIELDDVSLRDLDEALRIEESDYLNMTEGRTCGETPDRMKYAARIIDARRALGMAIGSRAIINPTDRWVRLLA